MKNNKKHYRAYLSINALTVMFIYLFNFIANNSGLSTIRGSGMIRFILFIGIFAVGIFAAIFQFYINGFLMKRRKKEYGLYSILGLEKKHVSRIMFYENCILYLLSLISGLVLGIVSGKGVFLLLKKLMKCDIQIDNSILIKNLLITALTFFIVSAAVYIYNKITIYKTKTIDMLKGSKIVKTKSKKENIIQLILGLAMIIVACVKLNSKLSIFTSLNTFFIMLALLLLGTFLVYGSMCSIILNLLKKSNKMYISKNRFFPISNMLFRCDQTSTGLASICIILTIISVIMTTTVSLYSGTEALVKDAYAYDGYIRFEGTGNDEDILSAAEETAENNNVELINEALYHEVTYSMFYNEKPDFNFKYDNSHDLNFVSFMTIDDYNKLQNENRSLSDNSVFIIAQNNLISGHEKITISGMEFNVEEYLTRFQLMDQESKTSTIDNVYVIMSSNDIVEKVRNSINSTENKNNGPEIYYEFGTSGSDENRKQFESDLNIALSKINDLSLQSFNTKNALRESSYLDNSIYLFIGFFLSLLFLGLMLVVMYHKQLQEAIDDAPKYAVMRKLGCSRNQCKKIIFNQNTGAYFIPIILSGVYSAVMFNTISSVLKMFMLGDISIIIKCMLLTYGLVLLIYAAGYCVSGKVYIHTSLDSELN